MNETHFFKKEISYLISLIARKKQGNEEKENKRWNAHFLSVWPVVDYVSISISIAHPQSVCHNIYTVFDRKSGGFIYFIYYENKLLKFKR